MQKEKEGVTFIPKQKEKDGVTFIPKQKEKDGVTFLPTYPSKREGKTLNKIRRQAKKKKGANRGKPPKNNVTSLLLW